MIFEQRTYTVSPGNLADYLALWEERSLPIVSRYAELVGCWQTESGKLNSVVFLWCYNDYEHRNQQRKKLASDPEWKKVSASVRKFLIHQESIFLSPTAFSSLGKVQNKI